MKFFDIMSSDKNGLGSFAGMEVVSQNGGRKLDFFNGLLNSTSDIILAIDRNYTIIAINNAARMATQLNWGKTAEVGTSIMDILPLHERERSKALYESILRGEPTEREHLQMISPKGGLQHYEMTYYLITDENGESAGIAMFIRDITDLFETQKKLREKQAELEKFMNAVPVGVFAITKNGTPHFANETAKEMLGKGIMPEKSASELGEVYQAYKYGTDEFYPIAEMPIVKALSGEAVEIDDMEIRNGEKRMQLEVKGTPVYDESGNLEYAIAAFQDSSARKKRERLLAKMQTIQQQITMRAEFYNGDFDIAVEFLTEKLCDGISVGQAGVWFVDDDLTKITAIDVYNQPSQAHLKGITLFAKDFPAYFAALREERNIVAYDAHTHSATKEFTEVYLKPNGIGAMLDVPIRYNGKLLGVICLEHLGGVRDWTGEEINFALYIADMASLALQSRERKKAEQKLRDSAVRLLEAQRVARIGDFDFDIATGELKWSEQEFEVFGVEKTITPTFEVFVNAIHPDDRARVIDEFQTALGNPTTHRLKLEFRVVHSNGEVRYTNGEVVIVRNEQGAPVRCYGTNQDITEQKLAEEKLLEQQAQMNAAADLAQLAFWEFNFAASSFTFNDRYYALLRTTAEREGGYRMTSEEYLKKFVPQEAIGKLLADIQAVARSTQEQGVSETLVRRADGEVRKMMLLYRAERNADGAPIRLFGAIQDVTSQKEAEEKLRQSQENFRKTVSSVPGMIYQFLILPDGTIQMPYVSEGCRDLYGLEPETIMQNPMALFEMMEPDDIAASQVAIAESAANLTPFVYETRYTLTNGKKIWSRYQGKPMKREDGLVVWYGVSTDITELKALEAELQARLHQIQETQNHLIQSEKMSALGQMVAGIAHELNTPIGYASNNVAIIRDRFNSLTALLRKAIEAQESVYAGELEAAFEKMQAVSNSPNGTLGELDETLRRTERLFTGVSTGFEQMTNLVRSMRNFSRLDEADMKKADINEGVKGCLLMVGHMLKDKDVELTTEYGEIPQVECFPAQLNQVFLNLVGNAIHAVEEKPNGRVHVQTSHEGDYVIVRVIDNGKGIPKHVQKKIFDPFFTTKPVGKGTGLGLSISYDIVKKHKGELSFETEEGVGTTFIVKIPAVEFMAESV